MYTKNIILGQFLVDWPKFSTWTYTIFYMEINGLTACGQKFSKYRVRKVKLSKNSLDFQPSFRFPPNSQPKPFLEGRSGLRSGIGKIEDVK